MTDRALELLRNIDAYSDDQKSDEFQYALAEVRVFVEALVPPPAPASEPVKTMAGWWVQPEWRPGLDDTEARVLYLNGEYWGHVRQIDDGWVIAGPTGNHRFPTFSTREEAQATIIEAVRPKDSPSRSWTVSEPVKATGRYRKKPIVIEAWRLGSDEPRPGWLVSSRERPLTGNGADYLEIHTLEGMMRAERGDWVIRGVQGELYPCKPDIFAATYEPVHLPIPASRGDGQYADLVKRLRDALTVHLPQDISLDVIDHIRRMIVERLEAARAIAALEAERDQDHKKIATLQSNIQHYRALADEGERWRDEAQNVAGDAINALRRAEAAEATIAELREQIKQQEWQPIETAPDWSGSVLIWVPDKFGGFRAVAQKDDTDLWLFGPEPPNRSFTDFGGLNGCFPTYWMPLPAPPSQSPAGDPQEKAG